MQMTSATKLGNGKRKAGPPPYVDKIIEECKKKIKTEPGVEVTCDNEKDEQSEDDCKTITACLRFLAEVGNKPEVTKGAATQVARWRLQSDLRCTVGDDIDSLKWLEQRTGLDCEALRTVAKIVQDAEWDEIIRLLLSRCSSPAIIRSLRKQLKVEQQQLEQKQELQAERRMGQKATEEDSSARQASAHIAHVGAYAENRAADGTEEEPKPSQEVTACTTVASINRDSINTASASPACKLQPEPLAVAIPSGPSSMMKPTMIDYVQCTKEQRFMYVLLPINTPEAPICDASERELTLACKAAFNKRAIVRWVHRLGDRLWYACFENDKARGQIPKLVNSVILLRGIRVIANHLPALPGRSFVADVPRSTSPSPEAVLASLTPELHIRRCRSMTLLHQTLPGHSRFIAYFTECPNLVRFYVPIQGGKEHLVFKPMNEKAPCWCKMYHNGKQCSAGRKYHYRHGRGGLGIWT